MSAEQLTILAAAWFLSAVPLIVARLRQPRQAARGDGSLSRRERLAITRAAAARGSATAAIVGGAALATLAVRGESTTDLLFVLLLIAPAGALLATLFMAGMVTSRLRKSR